LHLGELFVALIGTGMALLVTAIILLDDAARRVLHSCER
jgi:hypothetical protein